MVLFTFNFETPVSPSFSPLRIYFSPVRPTLPTSLLVSTGRPHFQTRHLSLFDETVDSNRDLSGTDLRVESGPPSLRQETGGNVLSSIRVSLPYPQSVLPRPSVGFREVWACVKGWTNSKRFYDDNEIEKVTLKTQCDPREGDKGGNISFIRDLLIEKYGTIVIVHPLLPICRTSICT